MAEEAVREVAIAVAAGACVDQFAQDQLIVFMALAADCFGKTSHIVTTELTLHTLECKFLWDTPPSTISEQSLKKYIP
jgi:RNA 3'-terminal phosphate cyclase